MSGTTQWPYNDRVKPSDIRIELLRQHEELRARMRVLRGVTERCLAGEDAHAGRLQDGHRLVRLLETEDDRRLARAGGRPEVVHVLDPEARFVDDPQDRREAAGLVLHFDGDYVGRPGDQAGILQDLPGLLRIADDEAQDPELSRVREGHRHQVDPGRRQDLAGLAELTRPVLQEERKLLEFHGSSLRGR